MVAKSSKPRSGAVIGAGHRGSPETGFLVLSLISGMLISYLACFSHIWHAGLACLRQHCRELQLLQVFFILFGPQERAEHPSQLLPYPLGGGRLPRVLQLFFSPVLFRQRCSLPSSTLFLTSSSTPWSSTTPSTLGVLCSSPSPSWVKSGDFVFITRGCGGFDIIIRGFGNFDAFYQWEEVGESGSCRQVLERVLHLNFSTSSTWWGFRLHLWEEELFSFSCALYPTRSIGGGGGASLC